MIDVVGVRFKRNGKIYYFAPNETGAKKNDDVIVETVRGLEYGNIVTVKEIDEDEMQSELKPVIRIATMEDKSRNIDNRNRAKEALIICEQQCKRHSLEMKLINAEYTFDNSKLLFYFTAEGRIDFRELVKDLASIFKTRIELRQIGVRDEAKTIGALGCCGRECCCSSFLSEFTPVSIKMAKDQGLSLNPTKISGVCGRLMCCLKYEQDGYEDILRRMPRVGEIVETERGKGTVVSTYTIQELVKIIFAKGEESEYELYSLDEVKRTKKFDKKFENISSELKEEEAKIEELKDLERE
ncbi:Cell fate regulator YaaT, PSP1 superfamily (controls sporulation, competence, biofilm development) [Anaerosphaera aminiphila DSM 21120]|uniref:Cell fate regulator YaaT, PSP1 superfamily (Controls sporulation, competence, biofilm development) n=1 Tax=Anaerosphaera aminiphila DSM 21120 TaxID=1120995 RepID=A0A1M5RYG3_9FIRM|nr:stage 0 sporulation family protein [Anaerosphaera aminiphila]SHH31239.1 Cell fate regulator YaaT, PSP1 superfamily (controls sporulation, competence, biofilm development) [Anaerosphaera aminiphila DSM 21120]